MYATIDAPSVEQTAVPGAQRSPVPERHLLALPAEVLDLILSQLLARSIRAVSQTCWTLRAHARRMSLATIPNMRLQHLFGVLAPKLLPHQVASLQWMLRREARHPTPSTAADPR